MDAHSKSGDGARIGLLYGASAYTIWGVFPLYLRLLDASAGEIVAHRILWSLPFGALLLVLFKQWREVRAAFGAPRVLRTLALSAALISGNWLVYVWAVGHERVIEASLGYYINPLMFIAFGVFLLNEKLRRLQIAAVGLACFGVLSLIVGAGVVPVISLVLAVSFSAYGYVRKTAPVGALPGLWVETVILAPVAALFLFLLVRQDGAHFGGGDLGADALLALSGPATVIPLVLFSLAARRLPLSVMGFLQYIGPSLQLIIGLHLGETFTRAHALAFGCIWIALALVTIDAALAMRRAKPIAPRG